MSAGDPHWDSWSHSRVRASSAATPTGRAIATIMATRTRLPSRAQSRCHADERLPDRERAGSGPLRRPKCPSCVSSAVVRHVEANSGQCVRTVELRRPHVESSTTREDWDVASVRAGCKDYMTIADIYRYPTQHYEFHRRQLTIC